MCTGEQKVTAVAMTVAGSDPSGGAGIQADLKTFHQHGVFGTAVITLLTVQNTQTVDAIEALAPKFVIAQLDAVLADIPPKAAKTGALANAGIIEALAKRAANFSFPLVVDPVMVSKHGLPLLDGDALRALRTLLLPRAFMVTPNLPEASALAEMDVCDMASMEKAAGKIAKLGPPHVLIKGGHRTEDATDILCSDGDMYRFPAARMDTKHTHGTGCVYSAAIVARLARGDDVPAAVRGAKAFVTEAIRTSPGLGRGFGPINIFADVPKF